MPTSKVASLPLLCQLQPSCLKATVRDTTHENGDSTLEQMMVYTHQHEMRKVRGKQSSYQWRHGPTKGVVSQRYIKVESAPPSQCQHTLCSGYS